MRANVIDFGTHTATVREVQTPRPGQGQVAVRPLRIGLDGTDVDLLVGEHGEPPPGHSGIINGHEVVGVVEEVGPQVEGFAVGDLVTATVRRPDPLPCLNCGLGQYDYCLRSDYRERGIKLQDGYLAERFVEEPAFLLHVPEALREYGCLIEPMSVVVKGLEDMWKVQTRMAWEPQQAIVLGSGPIGLFATALLVEKGIRVWTLNRTGEDNPEARLIEMLGGTHVNTREEELLHLADRLGRIDVIVEGTGYAPYALESMQAIGANGAVCLVSVTGGQSMVSTNAAEVNRNLVLKNSLVFGTVSSSADNFSTAMRELVNIQSRWPAFLDTMVDRRISLDEVPDALANRLPGVKTIVEMRGTNDRPA